jgi:hypothetical protein
MIIFYFILFILFLIIFNFYIDNFYNNLQNERIKVIVYDENIWEKTYLEELLDNNVDIIYTDTPSFIDFEFYKKNNIKKNKCILVFSSNIISYDDIKNISSKLKPLIIFHLSDEWGDNINYLNLAEDTIILFRQHYHEQYNNKYDNIHYIPLGYMVNNNIKSSVNINIKPIIDRKYIWSFVGNMKKDREEMINTLINANLGEYYFNNGIKPEEMFDIYNNSIFIPNGRGNIKLDCFRLYEASMNGAIPIVVGGSVEINNTFKKEENPPWIFASTWNEAVEICKQYLNNKNLLIEKQNSIVKWYRKRINDIKIKIESVIN